MDQTTRLNFQVTVTVTDRWRVFDDCITFCLSAIL